MPDSPAIEAGIEEGDIIVGVNDNKLIGLSLGEAVALINGEEGKPVVISISRSGELLSFTIMPKKIPYPTVTGEVIGDDIGYIRINSFGELTFNEFKHTLGNLRRREVISYIIDLRNNPGGYLMTVVNIAGYFIGSNVAMIVQDRLDAKGRIEATILEDMITEPVVFLINGGSASAAEILVAAVKDYKKGVLVGTSTYGKGVAQSVFKLNDGSLLKATTLKFFSPFGAPIEGIGVKPDVMITNMDSLLAGEILLGDMNEYYREGRYVSVDIGEKETQIDLNSLKNWNQWETYRQIIQNATSVSTTINKNERLEVNYLLGVVPKLQYVEIPKTIYRVGERASFKLCSPGYGNKVQYRVALYDEEKMETYDLWDTKDNYYEKWKPNGDMEFTIGFPVEKPGKYRIKIFVKRAGLDKSKTAISDMECDSYVEEIPFVVVAPAT
jgi:C-terminal peptidase prc